mgnify:CR=1 FL=1
MRFVNFIVEVSIQIIKSILCSKVNKSVIKIITMFKINIKIQSISLQVA